VYFGDIELLLNSFLIGSFCLWFPEVSSGSSSSVQVSFLLLFFIRPSPCLAFAPPTWPPRNQEVTEFCFLRCCPSATHPTPSFPPPSFHLSDENVNFSPTRMKEQLKKSGKKKENPTKRKRKTIHLDLYCYYYYYCHYYDYYDYYDIHSV